MPISQLPHQIIGRFGRAVIFGFWAGFAMARGSGNLGTAESSLPPPEQAATRLLGKAWHAETIPQWQLSAENWQKLILHDQATPDRLLDAVWTQLATQVSVFPGENYFYWTLIGPTGPSGGVIKGNIRLASSRREKGYLDLGYEFTAFPGNDPKSGFREYSTCRDTQVHCLGHLQVLVTRNGKSVTFYLANISQTPPASLKTATELKFLQRTQDESGATFLLCLYQPTHTLLWLLDPGAQNQESLDEVSPGSPLRVGAKSGFVFAPWQDHWWLLAVPEAAVKGNTAYDGPFDQLADNYAPELKTGEWLERIYPVLKGRIDIYGNYLNKQPAGRVALKNYGNYQNPKEIEIRWASWQNVSAILSFSDWVHPK